jgi:two-component system sensor histidine kinase UhpB
MKNPMQYQSLIQNLPAAAYTCDEMGFIKSYNNAAANLWGRKPVVDKELWCGSWKIFNIDGTDLPVDKCPMAITIKECRPVYGKEIIMQRPDGSIRHVNPYPYPLYDDKGHLAGAINMLIDITEKHEKAKLIEERNKNFIELAADGIFMSDYMGNITSANASGCKMLDYDKESLLKLGLKDIVPPQFAGKNLVNLASLKDGNPILVERQFMRRDGTVFYAELRAQVVPGGNVQAIVRDITERKNAEAKNAETLERYDILAKATSDAIWDWDIANKKMLHNEVVSKMFGYKSAEIEKNENILEWWKQNIHPDDLQRVTETLHNVFKDKLQNFQFEYRFRCQDATYKYVFDRAFVIFDSNNNPSRIIGAMQDITERKKAEKVLEDLKQKIINQKVQEQKKITRAIINAQEKERRHIGEELHDNINQMLAGTKLYISVAANNNIALKEVLQYPIELIDETMNEIRILTRKSVTPLQNINLKELVQLLLEGLDKNTAIKTAFVYNVASDFNDDDLKLNIYRIIQEQSGNIVKHAEAGNVRILIETDNDIVYVTVSDDGKGFNVNKKRDGIGITNIIHRVESFNGEVVIKSAIGKGCKLQIKIPY